MSLLYKQDLTLRQKSGRANYHYTTPPSNKLSNRSSYAKLGELFHQPIADVYSVQPARHPNQSHQKNSNKSNRNNYFVLIQYLCYAWNFCTNPLIDVKSVLSARQTHIEPNLTHYFSLIQCYYYSPRCRSYILQLNYFFLEKSNIGKVNYQIKMPLGAPGE